MLQEGIAHSFEMLTEAKGRNLEVKRWLKTDTLPPALEVVAPNQEMKDACSKPVKSRTLDDVLLIVRWMKEVPTFHEFAPFMDEQELIVYCLCLMLRRLAKFEALCRIGEMPFEVFYVLEGQIGVTNLNAEVFTAANLEDKVFHSESRGATIGEASILYNSMR